MKRAAYVALAFLPTLAWIGCGDDDTAPPPVIVANDAGRAEASVAADAGRPIADASRDATDASDEGDGGIDGEIVFTSDTKASSLGMTKSGHLFFYFDLAPSQSVAVILEPDGTVPAIVNIFAQQPIKHWVVGQYGVVYVDLDDKVFALRDASPTTQLVVGQLSGVATTCSVFAMDAASNVYCRGPSNLVRWPFDGTAYGAPVVLYGSNVPSGIGLAVDGATDPIYVDTTMNGIRAVPTVGTTGGAASSQGVVATEQGTFALFGATNGAGGGFGWVQDTGVFVTPSKDVGAIRTRQSIEPGTALSLQPIPAFGGFVLAGTGGLFLVPTIGAATKFRSGPATSGASSYDFVFWTRPADGNVYRAHRF